MTTHIDLTDDQWEVIKKVIPKPAKTGHPRCNDRTTINGILYVLRTGCRWNDLPEKYGSGVTCWRRFTRWSKEGVWTKLWRRLLRTLKEKERLNLEHAIIDSSTVMAKKGGRKSVIPVPRDLKDQKGIS
jgi:transposase